MPETPVIGAASHSLWDFLSRLTDTDFMRRADCISGRPEVVWLHVISDGAIALAYYSIPVALLYYTRRRRHQQFNWMFVMFALFILACGTTHVMSVLAFWYPMYRLDGVIKLATAGLSIATAITLWPLIPKALAIPSPEQLGQTNQRLQSEIEERKRAESQLQDARAGLEQRVRERTAELERVNTLLTDEIAERRRVEATLRSSEERFRVALRSSPITVFNQDRNLRYTWINNPQMGRTPAEILGRKDPELFPENTAHTLTLLKQRVLDTGSSAHAEVAIAHQDATRYFDFRAEPLKDAAGAITGITGVKVDMTDRKRAEQHMSFLLAELDHRVKNNLSVVLALAEESMRASSSMDEFSRAFIGRVRAVAKTHAALAASKWEGARLRDLVALTLESYSLAPLKGEPRVRVHVSGEQVQVSPKAASVICMTINELVTNAAKYGAFSNPTGVVDVSWDRRPGPDGESILRLQWVESGGPPVVPPARRGLGTQLIEEGVAYELGGHVHTEYRPEGLICTLEFPLNDQNTRRSRFEQAAADAEHNRNM